MRQLKNITAKKSSQEKLVDYEEKTLEEVKEKYRIQRYNTKLKRAKENPESFPIDLGVCWMCWEDLTGRPLGRYRRTPYSEVKEHPEVCPLCNYSHWKGRVWYPFKFLRGYIGNPSSRKFGSGED